MKDEQSNRLQIKLGGSRINIKRKQVVYPPLPRRLDKMLVIPRDDKEALEQMVLFYFWCESTHDYSLGRAVRSLIIISSKPAVFNLGYAYSRGYAKTS
jgi:hypothetical protein